MRALGVLALTVNLTPSFESVVKRHNEQVNTIEAIAKDLNEDAQALATNGTFILVVGGVVAVALGLFVGYLLATFLAQHHHTSPTWRPRLPGKSPGAREN